jgi:hypothetical protein
MTQPQGRSLKKEGPQARLRDHQAAFQAGEGEPLCMIVNDQDPQVFAVLFLRD